MTNIDLGQFKTGDEVVVTVELRAAVTSRGGNSVNSNLFLNCSDENGGATILWPDGKVTSMPSTCLNVTSVEKYVKPLPTEAGTLVRTVGGVWNDLYALNSRGDLWINLSGGFNMRDTEMDRLHEMGQVEVIR